MRPPGTPLQQRLLAPFDDRATEDGMTAEGLATVLSLPVPEVEAELETLVQLGNLTTRVPADGTAHYSAAPRRKLLGRMLVETGVITEEQLQEALAEQAQTEGRLGLILLERGYISKQTPGEIRVGKTKGES